AVAPGEFRRADRLPAAQSFGAGVFLAASRPAHASVPPHRDAAVRIRDRRLHLHRFRSHDVHFRMRVAGGRPARGRAQAPNLSPAWNYTMTRMLQTLFALLLAGAASVAFA